jgi:orotate phosphoribosyltransferase
MLDFLIDEGIRLIGGPEGGILSILGAIVCKSVSRRPVDGFYVRKEAKKRGTMREIEGSSDMNRPIALIEDITAAGASILSTARVVRAYGGTVAFVVKQLLTTKKGQ